MNVPIARLFALVCLLFALLVVWTSRWTVWEAEALRDHAANRRPLLEEQRIRRGTVRAANGRVLARSVRRPAETWQRRYPSGDLFAHAVGYSYIDLGRAGLERSREETLTGQEAELDRILDELRGKRREGNDLVTTLSPRGQAAALRALGGRRGAVVAIEPATGAVRVMASLPAFDPNELRVRGRFAELSRDEQNSPLLNRATQARYPPGSTFKVVTAAAALDTGRYAPGSMVDGSNNKEISGVPLRNFGGTDYGAVDLTTALTKSVNTVWAEVGVKLGKATMARYMRRFGFYEEPPLDYPRDQMVPSGERGARGLLSPTSDQIDVGRMAIGQDKLAVTPLQMAMVAAALANDGVLMEPHLSRRIVDPDGRTVERIEPEVVQRVVKPQTARQLRDMMRNVVREGTGTAAALEGVELAGKTGTAEIDPARDINQPWFIAFTDDVAVAVTVERTFGGQGGTVAAPIAKQVLEALS